MSEPPSSTSDLSLLLPRLRDVSLRDESRLRRRIDELAGITDRARRAEAFVSLAGSVATAEHRLTRRIASRPAVSYPDLPVSARREDILATVRDHQVVVVAGETGSGKTTQLPKMLLDAGRGSRGTIGHTQPRRIAARAVAERLADELHVELGQAVGYTVRFTDQASDRTLIRVMTDGVLLAEIADDPLLLRYDALIIDEAHERSLTIDMLLGYLTRLLPRRPDLSVVITSATIDPHRFAAHFGGAPVIEVSGRTYPVEIRYRPWAVDDDPDPDDEIDAVAVDRQASARTGTPATGTSLAPAAAAARTPAAAAADDRDQPDAICDAVAELVAEGAGDVLVFCSGEREIREAAEALTERAATDRRLARLEVVPLYARLSAAEQHLVFAPHDGLRVVVATNVAETSLTVPGIRYVVDTGTARISRFSRKTKVQRLPVEPVSKASARQRAGRCGRVADGICIRLYTESDFDARPEFTEPEILRTNLASVVLRMAALDVGPVEDFPFVDPPDRRAVRDAIALLEELHAVTPAAAQAAPAVPAAPVAPVLTPIGRLLSRLPVDPRLARMMVEAHTLGCLDELTVLAAALSIVDPRERPRDATEAADTAHRRFAQPDSDLLTLLAVWRHLHERRQALSGNAFRRMCRDEYLNYRRVREWIDLVAQLRTTARDLGWTSSSAGLTSGEPVSAAADRVHQAALTGLLSHVGVRLDVTGAAPTGTGRSSARDRSGEDYLGARGARFAVAPGSALGRRRPRWVMAAELVETSRLFARQVAAVEPGWVEAAAGDLAVRSYSEPRWDRNRAQVVATERVSLYGLPLVAGRSVGYGGIDAVSARATFIQNALVDGDWDTHHAFVRRNAEVLGEAEQREERTRRREVVAGETERAAFFAQRLPADIVSGRHFDRWWRTARQQTPDLLTYDLSWLLRAADVPDPAHTFPDRWVDAEAGLDLPLTYRFVPGADDDGVTVDVGLSQLARLRPEAVAWSVPGLREELVTELIRGLPKSLRRSFAPAPDHAAAVLAALDAAGRVGRDDLREAVAAGLTAMGGTVVAPTDLDPARLPPHLRLRVRVLDDTPGPGTGAVIAEGRDAVTLQRTLRGRQRDALAELSSGIETSGLRDWTIGRLPTSVDVAGAAGPVTVYPSLVDEGDSVAVRVFADPGAAAAAMTPGTVRLLQLSIASPLREVVAALPVADKLALAAPPGQETSALLADCVRAAVAGLLGSWSATHELPRTPEEFAACRDVIRADLPRAVAEVVPVVARILADAAEVGARATAVGATADGVRAHLSALVTPGFVGRAGPSRLPDLVRYVAADRRRLDSLVTDPARDTIAMHQWLVAAAAFTDALTAVPAGHPVPPSLDEVRWMLEEYRVSLFAQQLKTAKPVSEQRIRRAIHAATTTPTHRP